MSYEEIKQLAERDRIAFKKHAVLRMHQRKNLADEVKYALINGETIEKYPKDRPLPSQLVWAILRSSDLFMQLLQ